MREHVTGVAVHEDGCLAVGEQGLVGVLGRVLLAGAEEEVEDGVLALVIVVHDVDEHQAVRELGDERVARARGLVDV